MPQAQRRVRKVRLSGPDESTIRQGAMLLEDALHTASMPDANGSRLLLIRHLAVGPIGTWQSASTTALAIERRLRQLSISAVHGASPAVADQPAVFFRDDVEPYVLLARHLAWGRTPSEWYWTLAVNGWRPSMTPPQSARFILFSILTTEAGVDAAVALFQALKDDREVDFLLAALRPADGSRLLQAFGWTRQTPQPSLAAPPWATVQMTTGPPGLPELDRCLSRWSQRWGLADNRSFWLASITLLKQQPWRTTDGRLPNQAARFLAAHGAPARPASPPHLPSPARASTADHEPSPEERTLRRQIRPRPTGSPPAPEPAAQPQPTHPERATTGQDAPGSPAGTAKSDAPAPGEAELAAVESEAVQAKPTTFKRKGPKDAIDIRDAWLPWPDRPLPSQIAGLLFIIHILDRLDMAGFLRRYPGWLAYQFPVRLLQWIAGDLDAEADDPMLALLAATPAEIEDIEFVAPAIWRKAVLDDGPCQLHSLDDRQSVQVLFDSSGELPLALWSGPMPPAISELLGEQEPQNLAPLSGLDPAELLLSAWSTAVSRWLQRFTPLALPDLVKRPGRIAATRTHIDVFFDMQQTDIEVRRAGLDFDPGWVAWLGRVIHFHYVSDDADVFP